MTKYFAILISVLLIAVAANAQNAVKNETHPVNQNVVIRIDDASTWAKYDTDNIPNTPTPALGNENVAFYSAANGIFISILSGTNKIKLFALTGQLLLNGDLTQGRFFIPTRPGIYFLRINTKSYKVICK